MGVIINGETTNKLLGYLPRSDKIIMMKPKGTPFNMNVLELNAPTEDSKEEELEKCYEKLTNARAQDKEHEINVIMGDLNAK